MSLVFEKGVKMEGNEFYNTGISYFYGKGVEKNYILAKEQFEKGAELGSVDCKTFLGIMYRKGIGVTKDAKLAKKYLSEAADAGSAEALFGLGMMCSNGEMGFFVGKKKALEYWELAARKGHAMAQYNLAAAYSSGEYGIENDRQAAFWFMCTVLNMENRDESTKKESMRMIEYYSQSMNIKAIEEDIRSNWPGFINDDTALIEALGK